MACSFKFCSGRGKCFLEGVSPCSDHASHQLVEDGQDLAVARAMRQMGLTRTGFACSALPHAPELVEELAGLAITS